MKMTEQQKKILIVAVFVCFAGGYVYWTLFRDSAPAAAPAAPVITTTGTIKGVAPRAVSAPPGLGGAQKVATTAVQLDPTLHMEAMLRAESLVYSGTGRNIFSAGPGDEVAPVKMEAVKFPVRPGPVAPRGPMAPALPPGPPPINLKFFGTATSGDGSRRAFLLNGDTVWLASVGDVVERRYRIVSISASSILVEDIPNTNKQTLPLVAQ